MSWGETNLVDSYIHKVKRKLNVTSMEIVSASNFMQDNIDLKNGNACFAKKSFFFACSRVGHCSGGQYG